MKTGWTLAAIAAAAMLTAAALRAQDAHRTVWEGVYTDAQLQRGSKLYADQCSSCHGAEMHAGAGAPSLAGPEFTFGWDGKPVGELFDFVRMNMPPGQAGSLKDQEYVDIVSAILSRNGFPAGGAELPPDKSALDQVTFKADKP